MLDDGCIFCKIIKGEIPAAKVFEDEKTCVFKDVEPKAPVHLLAVPKSHFKLLSEAGEEDGQTLAHMLLQIPAIARANGCQSGYRLIINQGDDAGQTVHHLHIHILGGEKLFDF